MKATYKEIKEIKKLTPNELKRVQVYNLKQPKIEIGYYTPSNANWSYIIYVIEHNNKLIKIATTFGEIQ